MADEAETEQDPPSTMTSESKIQKVSREPSISLPEQSNGSKNVSKSSAIESTSTSASAGEVVGQVESKMNSIQSASTEGGGKPVPDTGQEIARNSQATVGSEEGFPKPRLGGSREKTRASLDQLEIDDKAEREKTKSSASRTPKDQRQCQRRFRDMIGKRELKNEQLEKRQGDLRERLDLLECSMPAVMVWNIWRMAQGAPVSSLQRVIEKQFQGPASGEAFCPSTPSRHYDCRVREVEAERKQASKRAEEARTLWMEKTAALEERKRKLEEAKKIQEERKEKIKQLEKEAEQLREALQDTMETDGFCETGECGDIQCKRRWLDKVSSSTSSIKSTDVECLERLQKLAEAELSMKKQIGDLEHREEAYMRTLRQADELWSKMEGDTASTLSTLQEQLDTKVAENQQMADYTRQLEADLEKLRDRMATCRNELEKFMSIEKIEAAIGRDDDFADVMDKTSGATVKVSHRRIGREDDVADVDEKQVLAKEEVTDKEILAKIEQQVADEEVLATVDFSEAAIEALATMDDKMISAKPEVTDLAVDRPDYLSGEDVQVGIRPEDFPYEEQKLKEASEYLAQLGSLDELYYDDDYGVCAPDFACNDVVLTETGMDDEELAALGLKDVISTTVSGVVQAEDETEKAMEVMTTTKEETVDEDVEELKEDEEEYKDAREDELRETGQEFTEKVIQDRDSDKIGVEEEAKEETVVEEEVALAIDKEEEKAFIDEDKQQTPAEVVDDGDGDADDSIVPAADEMETIIRDGQEEKIQEEMVDKDATGDRDQIETYSVEAASDTRTPDDRVSVETPVPDESDLKQVTEDQQQAERLDDVPTETMYTGVSVSPSEYDAKDTKGIEIDAEAIALSRNDLASWIDSVNSIRRTIAKCPDCRVVKKDADNLAKKMAAYAGTQVEEVEETMEEVVVEMAQVETIREEVESIVEKDDAEKEIATDVTSEVETVVKAEYPPTKDTTEIQEVDVTAAQAPRPDIVTDSMEVVGRTGEKVEKEDEALIGEEIVGTELVELEPITQPAEGEGKETVDYGAVEARETESAKTRSETEIETPTDIPPEVEKITETISPEETRVDEVKATTEYPAEPPVSPVAADLEEDEADQVSIPEPVKAAEDTAETDEDDRQEIPVEILDDEGRTDLETEDEEIVREIPIEEMKVDSETLIPVEEEKMEMLPDEKPEDREEALEMVDGERVEEQLPSDIVERVSEEQLQDGAEEVKLDGKEEEAEIPETVEQTEEPEITPSLEEEEIKEEEVGIKEESLSIEKEKTKSEEELVEEKIKEEMLPTDQEPEMPGEEEILVKEEDADQVKEEDQLKEIEEDEKIEVFHEAEEVLPDEQVSMEEVTAEPEKEAEKIEEPEKLIEEPTKPIDPYLVAPPYLAIADIEEEEEEEEEEEKEEVKEEALKLPDTVPPVREAIRPPSKPPTKVFEKVEITQTKIVHTETIQVLTQTASSVGTQTLPAQRIVKRIEQPMYRTATKAADQEPEISSRLAVWRKLVKDQSTVTTASAASQTGKSALSSIKSRGEEKRYAGQPISDILKSLKIDRASPLGTEQELKSINYGRKSNEMEKPECNCCFCGKAAPSPRTYGKARLEQQQQQPLAGSKMLPIVSPIPGGNLHCPRSLRSPRIDQTARHERLCPDCKIKRMEQGSAPPRDSQRRKLVKRPTYDQRMCACESDSDKMNIPPPMQRRIKEKRDQGCMARIPKRKIDARETGKGNGMKGEREGEGGGGGSKTPESAGDRTSLTPGETDKDSLTGCICYETVETDELPHGKRKLNCRCGDSD